MGMVQRFKPIPPGPISFETAAQLNRALAELLKIANLNVVSPLILHPNEQSVTLDIDIPDPEPDLLQLSQPRTPPSNCCDPLSALAFLRQPSSQSQLQPCDCADYTGWSGPYLLPPVVSSTGQTFPSEYQFWICGR